MAINPSIRDQAYQFFVEEALDLLQILETGLLTLSQERSTAKVHHLMRAAHSIKGGAASVGLEAIASLSHRLENILKAFYSETLTIDAALEDQLLHAYDCLRLPLTEQITSGHFNAEQALAIAEPVFQALEERLGEAFHQVDAYIPSSADLGVNMVTSILEVDVAQGLDQLTAIIARPQDYEFVGELRAQIEVFLGFAELLSLPDFGRIAEAAQQALDSNPHQALKIAQLALSDFQAYRNHVLNGTIVGSIEPSPELIKLASSVPTIQTNKTVGLISEHVVSNGYSVPTEYIKHINDSYSLDKNSILPFLEDDYANENISASIPSLEDIFGQAGLTSESGHDANWVTDIEPLEKAIQEEIASVETTYSTPADEAPALSLDVLTDPFFVKAGSLVPSEQNDALQVAQFVNLQEPIANQLVVDTTISQPNNLSRNSNLSVRVDSDRLERMNNLVGELAINRDGLSLQNEQLQGSLQELLKRFARFQDKVSRLRGVADQMLMAPERYRRGLTSENSARTSSVTETGKPAKLLNDQSGSVESIAQSLIPSAELAEFDPLEMDSYGALHSELQTILEDIVQLEETVDDVALFANQSNQRLEQQRHMLTHLRDELIWARMLPLSEVVNRFPRLLRDLSTTYNKPVQCKLLGSGVLIDKAVLEKLYDPLLHLVRNAFDHGIESPILRHQINKPELGLIEIEAYHQGNQTIIEVRDDGRGIDLDRICQRAYELGWLSAEEITSASPAQLLELIFEPGFSTAPQVSELSGRGVGLDVVRSQLQSVKGSIKVTSTPGKGTTFTLYLPLTLTIVKLVIVLTGSTALALPADSIEEILSPQPHQIRQSGMQRFLFWRDQIIPAYPLADLLDYECPLPDAAPSKALVTVPFPSDWAPPMLIMRQERRYFALEVDRLVTEQELVIKSFGAAIAPPEYMYGCTILGDGSLIPVIDGNALLAKSWQSNAAVLTHNQEAETISAFPNQYSSPRKPPAVIKMVQAPTILVVDDAVTLRRTLALSLERAGFRVIQAPDGYEAINQLEQHTEIQLVICDIEMPNMNGFEFLNHRRRDTRLVNIPVIMLTSRSNEKHRWLAMQLGATAYFTKPYLEQEILSTLEDLLN